jgi:hypothetical protein
LEPPTITGEIFRLDDNASSTPTNIIITSAPVELGVVTPYSLASDFYFTGGGSFTVAAGAITSGSSYFAYSGDSTARLSFNNAALPGLTGFVSLSALYGFPVVTLANGDGLDGVTFTPVESPEPSSYAMLFGGLGLLVLVSRLRRKLTA